MLLAVSFWCLQVTATYRAGPRAIQTPQKIPMAQMLLTGVRKLQTRTTPRMMLAGTAAVALMTHMVQALLTRMMRRLLHWMLQPKPAMTAGAAPPTAQVR
jgi:hypothetical protein